MAALRGGASLIVSHDISVGDARRFEDAVYGAEENLKQALGVALKGFNKKDESIKEEISHVAELGKVLEKQTVKS